MPGTHTHTHVLLEQQLTAFHPAHVKLILMSCIYYALALTLWLPTEKCQGHPSRGVATLTSHLSGS